ncbi:uncharacterized protein LOC144877809 [Branchiostoma floridae x Branchiostoma japonicum]
MHDLEVRDLEVIWVQLRPQWLPRTIPVVVLGLVYHPPCRNNKEGTDEMLTYLVTAVDSIHSNQPQAGILLCGDLNGLPLRRLQAAHPTLRQIVKQPTRGTAILDVVITNIAEHYCKPRIIPPVGRSDHSCVVLQPEKPVVKRPAVRVPGRFVTQHRKRGLAVAVALQDWAAVFEETTVQEKVAKFYKILTNLLDKHCPVKMKSVRSDDKGWITEGVKRAITKRQTEFLRHGKSPEWKRLRNKVNTTVRQAKNWHYRNCVQQLRGEAPRKWWESINRELGRSRDNGRSAITDELSADRISQYFSEAWCQSQSLYIFPLPCAGKCPDLCSIGEVKVLLKAINPRKAHGPDNIPNWMLKECADDLATVVSHLFNTSYAEGTVPSIWKSANVVPVPKSAGASQVEDFRPVSLLAVLAKLLERCVLRRLLPSLTAVIKDQYAYMKGSSTTIALVRMVQTWLSALDSRKPTLIRALFADMSKAFDRVDHALLLKCVTNLQISPHMVSWIHNYLEHRQQRVMTGGKMSDWRTLTSGVPQGGVLSPYLFLLFMSSRSTVYSTTLNVGYADDVGLSRTLLVAAANNDKTRDEEATKLDNWADDNKMTLNGCKSQLLQICFNKTVPVPPTLSLGGKPVPCVESAKGLGFIMDRHLTFNEQVNSMVTKASRRLHYVRLLTKQGTSVDDLIQVYITLVRPMLEYAHVLLVGCSKEHERAIERVQRRALRIISLGGRRTVPALPTLKERREAAAVKLLKAMLEESHPLHDLVPPTRTMATGRSLRNKSELTIPKARTKRLSNSFLHQAIRLYNESNG